MNYLKDNCTTEYHFGDSGSGYSKNINISKEEDYFDWSCDGNTITMKYRDGKTETIKNVKIVDNNTITGTKGNGKMFRLLKYSSVKEYKGREPSGTLFDWIF